MAAGTRYLIALMLTATCLEGMGAAQPNPSGQAPTPPQAQQTPTTGSGPKHKQIVCTMFGDPPGDERLAPGLAVKWVQELYVPIGAAVSLSPDDLPELKTGAVNNMAAVYDDEDQRRFILFNVDYVTSLHRAVNGDAAVMFALAHELGHHVAAHLRNVPKEQQLNNERAADAFAARVFARLRRTLEQTTTAVKAIPISDDPTHPTPPERENAVKKEFLRVSQVLQCDGDDDGQNCMHGKTCPSSQHLREGVCVPYCEDSSRQWDGNNADWCAPLVPWRRTVSVLAYAQKASVGKMALVALSVTDPKYTKTTDALVDVQRVRTGTVLHASPFVQTTRNGMALSVSIVAHLVSGGMVDVV